MVKIIGRTIYDFKNYIKENYDQSVIDKIFESCKSETTKKIKTQPLISFKWYDLEIYKDLINAFCEVTGVGLDEVAEYLAKKQVRGIYGVLLNFWSLENLLNNAEKNWKRYYSEGVLNVKKIEENIFDVSVKGIPFDDNLTELTHLYMEKLGEFASKKKVKSEILEKKEKSLLVRYTIGDE